jgi:hypothetical protein
VRDVAARAVPSASGAASAASSAPGAIDCVSDDDCWLTERNGRTVPTRRPTNLRGKKVRPCSDGDYTPQCTAGTCSLLAWRC